MLPTYQIGQRIQEVIPHRLRPGMEGRFGTVTTLLDTGSLMVRFDDSFENGESLVRPCDIEPLSASQLVRELAKLKTCY